MIKTLPITLFFLTLLMINGCKCQPAVGSVSDPWPQTQVECETTGEYQGYEVRPPGNYQLPECVPIHQSPGRFCCPRLALRR